LACLAGGLVGLLPHLALLTGGGFSERNLLGGFYDAQAHSLLDLRWDVPAEALSVEAFVVHGKAYTYFGPTPALLRLPVAALTDRFDGRLTAASLLLAAIVTVVALADLAWRVRRLVAGERPAGGGELLGFAAFSFLLAAGSSLLFLSSAPVVYHEAIAWGVALALGADAALLAYLARRRWRRRRYWPPSPSWPARPWASGRCWRSGSSWPLTCSVSSGPGGDRRAPTRSAPWRWRRWCRWSCTRR
jgi:hypothetical protein